MVFIILKQHATIIQYSYDQVEDKGGYHVCVDVFSKMF